MRETYVRPPLMAREPRPRWVTVWPLRLLTLVIFALLLYAAIKFIGPLISPTEQTPGID